jgi:hypothetical protein
LNNTYVALFLFEEDASRIKHFYIEGQSIRASKELLDAVFNSEALGKWLSFIDSLEHAGKALSLFHFAH